MNRQDVKTLNQLLKHSPALATKFNEFRDLYLPIKPSQYDITNVCNMSCPGCLYFEGDGWFQGEVNMNYGDWLDFFKKELARGVNLPHFGGAEASLNLTALEAASQVFERGVIYTNGSFHIPREIPFSIQVSIWSSEENEADVRGNSFLRKALQNYRNDSRAIFVCTLSRASIDDLAEITKMCAEHNVQLTFNHFSRPTHRDYAGKFLRASQIDQGADELDLSLSSIELERAQKDISNLRAKFPKTIVYSDAYAEAILRSDFYTLDANNIATNCASRLTEQMQHYLPDLSREHDAKCCTPNIECSSCTLYSMAYASLIDRLPEYLGSAQSFNQWLEISTCWAKIFIRGPQEEDTTNIRIIKSVQLKSATPQPQ